MRLNAAIIFLFLSIAPISGWALSLDDFNSNGEAEALGTGNSSAVAVSNATTIGGSRTLKANVVTSPSSLLGVSLATSSGLLAYSQDAGTTGGAELAWDGDTDPNTFNKTGLNGINLLEDNSTGFIVNLLGVDPPATLRVTVYQASDPDKVSEASIVLNSAVNSATPLEIQFASFIGTGPNGAADFSDVGGIRLAILQNSDQPDIVADSINTNGECDEVPIGGQSVYDECEVCGGDNTSCAGCDGVPNSGLVFDECGVCGGNNSSCAGCDGEPNSGVVFDECGVCGGNNSSCAGCDGAPNSGKVLDQCGVCDGDGQSCITCHEENQGEALAKLDGGAKALESIIDKIQKRLLKVAPTASNKAYVAETDPIIHNLQLRNWLLSWTLPVVVRECEETEFCTSVSNLPILDEYRVHNLELLNYGLASLKKIAKKFKFETKIDKKFRKSLTKQYELNESEADIIPTTQDVCF